DGAVVGDVDGAALVLEAAERRVLDRCRVGVPGIHLDDVAEAVDLVGLGGEVEAAVDLLPPPVGRVGRDPVAVQLLEARRVGDLPRGAEVLVEVLLAGEHGAPRGVAARAVVERAQDTRAGGVGGRAGEATDGGAAQFERGQCGDPAVVGSHHRVEPAVRGAAGQLDHGQTVRSPGDLDLLAGRVLL